MNCEIKRDFYLQKFIDSKNNKLIKIVTGIRRCGKSYLLFELFKKHLLSEGVRKDHIITIQLETRQNRKYRNPDVCDNYVRSLIKDKKTYYVFIDEIQLMEDFESVLNGFLLINNLDVYVTGSNSKFLSSDIITEFRGRGDEIRVYPLSFAELCSIHKKYSDDLFNEYFNYGGLPLVALQDSIQKKKEYLTYQTNNIYINDIIERNNIQNKEVLATLIEVISSGIGSLSNPTNITNTFNTELKISVTDKTISSYLNYLEDAFLIQKAKRYDVKGRKYIGTPLKYYFIDMGIRNSLLNFRQVEKDHIMENIIYNELKVRGYSVDIGIVEERLKKSEKETGKGKSIRKYFEIDFICNKESERYYIQSAYGIPDSKKLEQESKSLLAVKDAFKKIIIVKENTDLWRNKNGVLIMSLKEFLLNPKSLYF